MKSQLSNTPLIPNRGSNQIYERDVILTVSSSARIFEMRNGLDKTEGIPRRWTKNNVSAFCRLQTVPHGSRIVLVFQPAVCRTQDSAYAHVQRTVHLHRVAGASTLSRFRVTSCARLGHQSSSRSDRSFHSIPGKLLLFYWGSTSVAS